MEKYLSGFGEVFIIVSYRNITLIKSRSDFVVCKNVHIVRDNNCTGLDLIHWEFGHYFNSFKKSCEYFFQEV